MQCVIYFTSCTIRTVSFAKPSKWNSFINCKTQIKKHQDNVIDGHVFLIWTSPWTPFPGMPNALTSNRHMLGVSVRERLGLPERVPLTSLSDARSCWWFLMALVCGWEFDWRYVYRRPHRMTILRWTAAREQTCRFRAKLNITQINMHFVF